MSEPRVGVCDAPAVARAIDFAEERMQRLLVPDPVAALSTDCERSWMSPLPDQPAQHEAPDARVDAYCIGTPRGVQTVGAPAYAGRCSVNVLPEPISLVTLTRPPCACATCLTIASPRPDPGMRASRSTR